MLTFYIRGRIRGRSSLRIQSLTAGITLIAARFATVAPHGEIQTLGEHGLLCGDLGRHARPGAHIRAAAWLAIVMRSAPTWRRSRASPKSRTAFEPPRFPSDFDHHPPPKLFCQQRWCLLVAAKPGPGVFR